MSSSFHTPVLRDESVKFLVSDSDGTYVDGTLGGGGHAQAICERLGTKGRLIGLDADEDALRAATRRLEKYAEHVTFVHSNFRYLRAELARLGVGRVSGILLDLGVSSYQIDEESKGFSFRGDEKIDMRMDRRQALTGWDVVNSYDVDRLAEVIWKYGEERNSRRIARRLVDARPVQTTGALAAVVESAVGKKFLVKTLARVFQAIRIEVNDELRSLEQVLTDSVELIAPGGRIVVIAYHSLEDRIVKMFFRNASLDRIPSGHKYVPDTVVFPTLRILTKSPVLASEEEVAHNPRARSAKMRVAERLAIVTKMMG
ncbi:MAG: 16S rRNA (cytosine(1402)-N(4))-methyltransferase RsmH [Ignavibacteriae bacterium]|nr:16S rRNA (cytosine(1402)-N(4))-methyltransferase RsmH [Ignavibacteriota bacterium]